jgi:phosphoglycerate dehydrogenase-like enzyme
MTMLTVAKGYREVVRAQDRHAFLDDAPGTRELAGGKALVLGQGAIGQAIDRILRGFGVETETVRRGCGLGWKARLGEFDWVVLALPGTPETRGLIGAAEFMAMKREAIFINFARADIVEDSALVAALRDKRIAAAVLDVTDPEPLPPGHPLWQLDNAHLTMHLSGIPTPASLKRAAERFARNGQRFRNGEPLEAQVDLRLGY